MTAIRRPSSRPLSLPDAARLLTTVGQAPVSHELLEDDIVAGAPVNADGTLNLLHYAAWLVRELAGRTDGGSRRCCAALPIQEGKPSS